MKTIALTLVAIAYFTTNVFSQASKVETVRMILEDADATVEKDLRECKANIDAALENPKTADDPKMWYYRGLT
jgi:hypothetical protein